MGKITKYLTTTAAVATLWCVMSTGALAAPEQNKKHELAQPDGSTVQVLVTGDEYYQQIESPDGYTLCRDKDGWICYAKLNEDETDYVSTGEVYKGNNTLNDTLSDSKIAVKGNSTNVKNSLEKHLKIKKSAVKSKADAVREKLHGMEYTASAVEEKVSNTDWLSESKIQNSSTSGNVNGLAILVDFPDKKSDIAKSEIEQFFNGVGYTGFGNNGSVRDFYYDVSGGKVTYTNQVMGFYTAKHPKSYYDDINEETGSYAKSDEFANEVFQWLKKSGYDMSNITTDSNGYAKAVNILYAGKANAGWAKGLWPHQSWYTGENINGAKIQKYEMSDIGDDLSIYTICHESGHMIYGYPDLYDYDGDSSGTGPYSLMSGGANEKNPTPPDPYCRDIISGWNNPINMNTYGDGTTFDAVADGTGHQYSYKWSGKNANEYYLIENMQKVGRYADLPSEGLAIWHVDEKGDNSKNNMTANSHYLVSIEQADGRFDLENNKNYYDDGDLFRGGYKDSFGDSTNPNSKWWNGTSSGLKISQISESGNEMTFVQGTPSTNPDTEPTKPDTKPDTSKGTNIAGQAAEITASYTSDWASTKALNDGIDPSSSSDRSSGVYANYPNVGTQSVQYVFPKNFTISSCDVYWYDTGDGMQVPASYRILYWDGTAWQEVKNPKGLDTKTNQYNTTTFTPVSTNAIAIQMTSKETSATGIIEWKVYGK